MAIAVNPYIVPMTVRCAAVGCEHVKGANNHWFTVLRAGDVISFRPGVAQAFGAATAIPVCGEACLLRVISEMIKKLRPVSLGNVPECEA